MKHFDDATPVTWFQITWDWTQPVDQVISSWQTIFTKPDQNWLSHLDLWSSAFPKGLLKKMPIRVFGIYCGEQALAKSELQPLLTVAKPTTQLFEQVSWDQALAELERATDTFLSKQPVYTSRDAFIKTELPAQAIEILNSTLKQSTWPLFNVMLTTLGRIPGKVAACNDRSAKFLITYSMEWLDPDNDKPCIAEVEALRLKLLSFTECGSQNV